MFFRKNNKPEIQFTSQTRDAIKAHLIDEFDFFLSGSLDFLEKNIKDYHRVAFENVASKIAPFEVNLESCRSFLLNSKDDINQTVFELKRGRGTAWWENEILYPFSKRMPVFYLYNEGVTPFFQTYIQWQKTLHYACENEFWSEHVNLQAYESFLSLNIFEDKIFKSMELSFFERKREYLLDKTVWFKYVRSLITMFFPEFNYNEKFPNKKVHRFLLQLKDDVWFGFEYEESEMLYQLKKGIPHIPDYLNLVVINTSFNKNEKFSGYYSKQNSSIISLGILSNPFFYHPCFPMLGFSAVDAGRSHEQGNTYRKNIVQLDDDNYQIIHPARYGESMKKHAFFYLSLLSATSKIYLDYLSIVLEKAIA